MKRRSIKHTFCVNDRVFCAKEGSVGIVREPVFPESDFVFVAWISGSYAQLKTKLAVEVSCLRVATEKEWADAIFAAVSQDYPHILARLAE